MNIKPNVYSVVTNLVLIIVPTVINAAHADTSLGAAEWILGGAVIASVRHWYLTTASHRPPRG